MIFALAFLAPPVAAQQPGSPALPGWMSGCWRQVQAGVQVDEVWLAPAGGVLLGMSRSVEADSLRSQETMMVRVGPNGLVFEAAPSGQPPGMFLASAVTDTSVIFENLTHDFPQMIRYAKRGADSLLAMISGTVRDRQRTINYSYGRVSCPGS